MNIFIKITKNIKLTSKDIEDIKDFASQTDVDGGNYCIITKYYKT